MRHGVGVREPTLDVGVGACARRELRETRRWTFESLLPCIQARAQRGLLNSLTLLSLSLSRSEWGGGGPFSLLLFINLSKELRIFEKDPVLCVGKRTCGKVIASGRARGVGGGCSVDALEDGGVGEDPRGDLRHRETGASCVSISTRIYGTFPVRFGRSRLHTTRTVRVIIEHSLSCLIDTVSPTLKIQQNFQRSLTGTSECAATASGTAPLTTCGRNIYT